MHKTKKILFLCLSLLFTAQTIATIPDLNLPYLIWMQEHNSIQFSSQITNYNSAQNADKTVCTVTASTSGAIAYLARLGNTVSDTVTLTENPISSISTIPSARNEFITAYTIADGKVYATRATYRLYRSTTGPQFTGSDIIQPFGFSDSYRDVKVVAFEDDLYCVVVAIRNSDSTLVYKYAPYEKLADAPLYQFSTYPVDGSSKFNVSSNSHYMTFTCASNGDGKILRTKKPSSPSGPLDVIDTITYGRYTTATNSFTHYNGSVTLMGIDTAGDLRYGFIDSAGAIRSYTTIDTSASQVSFSPNNDGFVTTYLKGAQLYASTGKFSHGLGGNPEANPSYPLQYMIGTEPYCQKFQKDQVCFGGKEAASGHHKVFSLNTTTNTFTLIYTSSEVASSTLPFNWATIPVNFTIPREERSFTSPVTGDVQLNMGVTSVYLPAEVLNSINKTYNKVKTQ